MDAHVLSLSQIFAVPTFLFTLIRSETILSWSLLPISVTDCLCLELDNESRSETANGFMIHSNSGSGSRSNLSILHPILRFRIILFAERALFQYKNIPKIKVSFVHITFLNISHKPVENIINLREINL